MMRVFDGGRINSGSKDFLAWREANPRGLVVNVRSPKRAMLHRADCAHLEQFKNRVADFTASLKACSLERGESERWARSNLTGPLALCSHCDLKAVRRPRLQLSDAGQ
jgi:hypothetical protein